MVRLAVLAAAFLCVSDPLVGQGTGTALVRRTPNLNGGTVDGSVQMMSSENVALTATATITGDLLVPGMPDVRINGNPTYSGTIDGSGSALPAGYQITLGGGVRLRNVVRRTNPVAIASVGAPRPTSGAHSVVRKSSSDPLPDFSTLRDLTLTNGAGQIAVPPGAYGDFTAHDKSGFTLGISGATEPAHYDFQHLNLSAGSELVVVGPVVVTVGYAVSTHGVMGSSAQPAWLTLNIFSGGLTLAGAASVAGYVNAPAGTVALSGNARLTGGVSAESITMLGDSVMRLQPPPILTPNVPPTVAWLAPAEGTLFTAPASMLLSASASDPDGTVTKVEFFQGSAKLGEATGSPFEFVWNNAPPGTYVLTARAYDDDGASTVSTARNVKVQIGLPYFTGFEATDGYILGALAGQLGWSVTGSAALIESAGLAGSRALLVGGAGTAATATHGFPNSATPAIAFVDLFAKPAAGPSAGSSLVLQADAAQVAFVRTGGTGQFVVLDGNGSGGGTWVPVGSIVALGSDGRPLDWQRITVREDFGTKRWDLYIDGRLVSCDLGFADNAAQGLSQLALGAPEASSSLFDELFAGFDNPLFGDGDRDGMPDAWETSNGLNLLINDRNGDLDADGVTNIREYQHGTLPTLGDTDGDGLPDAWEIQYRLAPTRTSATDDSDADGLTDLQEFNAGTNPSAADTDGDGMPDGWELTYGLNPLQPADAAADVDGDGKTNLLEYQTGTNPNEYYNGTLPVLVSLVGPNLRPGANGLVAIRVTQSDGTLLANAPLGFEAVSGGILLSASPLGTSPAASVAVFSDTQGIASVYIQYPTPPAPLSTLVAIARSGTQTKTLSITVAPPITDSDGDGLHDPWEQRYLGTLSYGAGDDPGGVGRTLAQSHFEDVSPWPPPVVGGGLQVWYRADLGIAKDAVNKVSRWTDVSGNGVHALQTNVAQQPVSVAAAAGNMPVVRFNGSTTALRTAPADLLKGSTDITVITVIRPASSQVAYADILDYDHATTPYGGFVLQQNWIAANEYGLVWRNPSGTGWEGMTPTVTVPTGAAQVLSVVKSGTTQSAFLNSEPRFTVGISAQVQVNPPRALVVGNFGAAGDRPYNGDLAEVFIYNRALSASERTQVETALAQKYAGSN